MAVVEQLWLCLGLLVVIYVMIPLRLFNVLQAVVVRHPIACRQLP